MYKPRKFKFNKPVPDEKAVAKLKAALPDLQDNFKKLQEKFLCKVCNKLLNDPHRLQKCAHIACKECFEKHISTAKCPICQVKADLKQVVEDELFKKLLVQIERMRNCFEKASKDGKYVSKNAEVAELNTELLAEKEKSPSTNAGMSKKLLTEGKKEKSPSKKAELNKEVLDKEKKKSPSTAFVCAESNKELSTPEVAKSSKKEEDKSTFKEPITEELKDSLLDKTDMEIISPTAQNISHSTPKIRRKKKILPKSMAITRRSTSDNSSIMDISEISDTSISKRKCETSTRSDHADKPKCNQSPNTSVISPNNFNKRNYKGETLLHRAVIKGNLSKVKELIEAGATVNTQDNNGWTPLHEASNHGYVEIAKLLIDNGALVNVPSQKDNITPLHDALINDQMQIAIILASRGADMHAKTSLGLTALDLCKNDEDKATLVECCSPFIAETIPPALPPPAKVDNADNKIVLLHTSLNDVQKEQLQKFAQMVNAVIEDNFTSEVTHIITSCDNNGNCIRTMKILTGILSGKWIMNFQWIEVCLEYKQKVNEEVFEIQGTKHQPSSQGPNKSRKNMEQKYPPLFDGFYFYLHGQFRKPSPGKEDLLSLINLGGGKVLSREPREETVVLENFMLPFHAAGTPMEGVNHIILYQERPPRDTRIVRGRIRTAQVMWLIECIGEFELKKCIIEDQSKK